MGPMRWRPLYLGLAGLAAVGVLILLWVLVHRTLIEPAAPRDAVTSREAAAPRQATPSKAADASKKTASELFVDDAAKDDGSRDPTAEGAKSPVGETFKADIHLYFVAAEGRHLVAETRTVMRSADPVAFGRQIVLALLEGPRTKAGRSLPEDTGLRAFYLGEDGTAYVDLDATVSRRHPGGVTLERLSIYSLVNSLVLSCDAIRAVHILIEGQEARTLAGHIDLQRDFNANMLIIK
jgi:hypothetical protein